jgi:hypothetical protein
MPARVRQGTNCEYNLSPDLCHEIGLIIRAGVEACDKTAISNFFQSLFNISAELTAKIEISDDLEESHAFLAISVTRGMARLNIQWLLAESKVRLYAWLSMRRRQGAKDEDFLFGAPRISNTRHLHAETYALVELALKVGSGDPNATSHGARHRGSSERTEAAISPDSQFVDVNPLDQISAAAGQNVTQSLREAYVHLFEKPLYEFTQKLFINEKGVDNAVIPGWINDLEFGIELDRAEQWKSFSLTSAPLPSPSFSSVLEAIEDVSRGFSLDSTALRSHMCESAVKKISKVCAAALYAIEGHTSREVREFASRDFHQQQLYLISKHSWFRQTHQDKYEPLREWLNCASTSESIAALAKKAIEELHYAVKGGFINATDDTEISSLIQAIRDSGTPPHRVLVQHAIPESALPKSFRRYGFQLRPDTKVRRGRFKVRLFICAVDADSPGARDAAIAMLGFYALFSAADSFFHIVENQE